MNTHTESHRNTCRELLSPKLYYVFTHSQSTLEQLDLEQFSSQVVKYGKYVNQLEKGLPRNNVVPRLKDKVEVMKQRVSRKICPKVIEINVGCVGHK